MPPTCRRHVADCPIQVRTKSSSDDDDYEMLVSFVFISIMLPTLTQAAIASMQRTTPTPAATLTIIDAGKRPPRDWRTHTLPVIGLQPPPSSSSPAVRQHRRRQAGATQASPGCTGPQQLRRRQQQGRNNEDVETPMSIRSQPHCHGTININSLLGFNDDYPTKQPPPHGILMLRNLHMVLFVSN